ncbi:MAG: polyhydroxybutyrate depolymerase [Phycisphaerales bacterium]|jgi:polyhydroxybutyrate depolymerase
MIQRILFVIVLTCLTSTSHAQSPLVTDLDTGRGTIPVYRPSTYTPSEPIPLIIALHGFTNSGNDVTNYFDMIGLIETENFLFCAPDGTKNFLGQGFWNDLSACCNLFDSSVDDVAYLHNLIELLKAQYEIDERSIHFVGYSNGGFMAYRMACEYSDTVASIVSLAGATPSVGVPCSPTNPVSVLQIHGTADSVIDYNGGCIPLGGCYPGATDSVQTWALINACDPVANPVPGSFDLASSVAGSETTAVIYDSQCDEGFEAELWTMAGADHGPPFVSSPAGDGTSNEFSVRAVNWMLSHRKPGPEACPADMNGDGFLDNGDIGVFVNLFLAGDLAADLNGDGILDNGDIGAFVALFLAGC